MKPRTRHKASRCQWDILLFLFCCSFWGRDLSKLTMQMISECLLSCILKPPCLRDGTAPETLAVQHAARDVSAELLQLYQHRAGTKPQGDGHQLGRTKSR